MGVQTTINELVERLLALTGSDIEPEYLPQEQMFVTHRIGSTELAERADSAFAPRSTSTTGLGSVIEWRRAGRASACVRRLT